MVTYVARSAWTSTSASGDTLTGSKLRGVAVHWPGTTSDTIGTSGIEDRLRGYRDFHVNSRGWRDIGYNFAIDQAGRVYMLRSTTWYGNMVGAHCASDSNPDANHEYVGVLLLLGDRETPSAAMVQAFQHWYHIKFLAHWSGRTDVRGHRQVAGAQTNCPGDRAIAKLDELTQQPSQEDDMALSNDDWDRLERLIDRQLEDGRVQRYDLKTGKNQVEDGERKLYSIDNTLYWNNRYLKMLLAARIDISDLAQRIAANLPAGAVDVATVEQGVRNVLGGLDE